MSRVRTFFEHALPIIAGGTTFWLVQWLSLPLIALIPGYEPQVAEWMAVMPVRSGLTAFLVSLVLGGGIELLRHLDRNRRDLTLAYAMMIALVSIQSRVDGTPEHLRDVLGLWGGFRFAAVFACVAVIALVRDKLPATTDAQESVRADA